MKADVSSVLDLLENALGGDVALADDVPDGVRGKAGDARDGAEAESAGAAAGQRDRLLAQHEAESALQRADCRHD